MEDRQIIDLYWQRSSDAILESERKYGAYCRTISRNILQNREDAEECVNDTWLKAWNAMPPHRPTRLALFFAKIVRHLSFNRAEALSAQKRGGGELPLVLEELAECVAAPTDVESEYEARELGRSLNRFIGSLPTRDANIFLRRYFFTDSVAQISARYGLSENHTGVLLSRMRQKLRQHLTKEGFFHE